MRKTNAGQESVWDYPRPPKIEETEKRIRVVFNGEVVAESTRAKRVIETSHPPTYYIPEVDIRTEYLIHTSRKTVCEFKGVARYYSIEVNGKRVENACWSYPEPETGYTSIKDHYAFYAGSVDGCFVDEERVKPQPGCFYGGWITHDIVGPFKG
jgi:uncharacterized protein (DUF427 family)